MDVIDRINALLAANGKSGADMSRDLGFSNSIYSQWNTKKTKPSNKTIAKIADYFGVSVDYLLFGGLIPGSELKDIFESESERLGVPMDELFRAFNERTGDSIALNGKNISEYFDSFFGESAKKSPAVSSEGLTEDEKRILEKFRAASEDKRFAAEYVLGLK